MRETGRRVWVANGDGPRSPGVSSPGAFARTWWQAVRAPWLASASLAGCAFLSVQLLLLVFGTVEDASRVTGLLMVFGPATVIATLPDTTVQWRVGSLWVALHAGPLSYAPPEGVSFGAFLDSWGETISDGRGMLVIFLWGVLSLPVLELVGAWLRRDKLAQEAVRRSRGTFTW